MSYLQKAFDADGVASEAMVALADPRQVFRIVEGAVDVFAVPLEGGFSTGQRRHLARMVAGDLLFGWRTPELGFSVMLIAVGTANTVLRSLDLEELIKRTRTFEVAELAAALDRWVAPLWTVLHDGPFMGDADRLIPDVQRPMKAGSVFRVMDEVLWAKVGPAHRVPELDQPPWRGPSVFPLVRGATLEMVADAPLLAVTTATLLAYDKTLKSLRAFHQALQARLAESALLRNREEREWLSTKAELDRKAVSNALVQLAMINARSPVAAAATDEAEIAFRHLAHALGVDLKTTPRAEAHDHLAHVEALARKNRMRTRSVTLRGEWWKSDAEPLLGFTHDGAPIALIPHNGAFVAYRGGTAVPIADLVGDLSPMAIAVFRPLADKLSTLDLITFAMRGTGRDLAFAGLVGAIAGMFGTMLPLATAQAFDFVIPSGRGIFLVQLVVGLLTFAVAAIGLDIARAIALLRVETRTTTALEAAVWDRLLALPATFFRKYSAGDLADRADGFNSIRRAVSGSVLTSVTSGVFAVWNLVVLFTIDVRMAAFGTGLAAAAALVALIASAIQLRLQRNIAALRGKLSGRVFQMLSGIAKLRVAAAEGRAFSRWAARFSEKNAAEYKGNLVDNAVSTFEGFYPVIVTGVLFLSAANLPAGEMSMGRFLAFYAALMAYLYSLLSLIGVVVELMRVVPLFERARVILQAPTELPENHAHPGQLRGDIEVSHLSFRYAAGQPLILDDVSFRVEPGEFVAIVGPSGSGKSTLLRHLLGFEVPEAGAVYYSGQDLSGVDRREVRRQLGVVLQTNELVGGSIAEVVAGAHVLTRDQVWEALELAALADEVREMPMQLHTMLMQGGGSVSGGQRQRLLIAQSLAHRPKILIFDEATSALDAVNQAKIMTALQRMRMTRIVVAHRLSTVRNADRIVVLVNGHLVQQGKFDELMAVDGPFAELAKRQMA